MQIKALIFDMDGVIVDVKDSYRKCIVKTSKDYLKLAGIKASNINLELTQKFKLVPGFNNDWDLTYGIILCCLTAFFSEMPSFSLKRVEELLNSCKKIESFENFEEKNFREEKAVIKQEISVLKELASLSLKRDLSINFDRILKKAKKSEKFLGIEKVESSLESLHPEAFKLAKKFLFKNLAKRMFQEKYLGKELFERKYKREVLFFSQPGLISNEKFLLNKKIFDILSKNVVLGIVSGREKFEILYTLERLRLKNFFREEFIISSDEMKVSKPDPLPLIEVKQRIQREKGIDNGFVYVGDAIDDILAAKKAGFIPVAVLFPFKGEEREKMIASFLEFGAAKILSKPEDLLELQF